MQRDIIEVLAAFLTEMSLLRLLIKENSVFALRPTVFCFTPQVFSITAIIISSMLSLSLSFMEHLIMHSNLSKLQI